MAKRRMVQYNLVKNAVSAYFAAIEIHNKPNIAYRYETVTLLLMNAWELVLKAYIKKNLRGERSIFEKDNHTISFDKALGYVADHINSAKPKSFMAVKENLLAVEDYRNNVAHFYCDDLQPCIFTLVSRCALNFVDFLKTYFNRDIIAEEGLFIMPLGFKLPFNPEEFLAKTSPAYTSSTEAKRFVDRIVRTISSLKEVGVEDSIVLGFDVYLQTVKKPENSDLLLKITSKDSAGVKIASVKSVRLSNDPNAQAVKLDDSAFLTMFPYTYKDVVIWCKTNVAAFQQGKRFNDIMKVIKENTELASTRRLNPRSKSSSAQTFYTEAALAEVKKRFEST
jgi:hypothetical protein